MKELGMVLFGCMCFVGFFSTMIYPELEYKGYSSTHSCTGECYEEYVRTHGSVVEQLIAKTIIEELDDDLVGAWTQSSKK